MQGFRGFSLYVMEIDGTYHTYQLNAGGTCRTVDPEGMEACWRKGLSILDLTWVLVVAYLHKSISSSSNTFAPTFLVRSRTLQTL